MAGWMDQDATWYGGRPRRRSHCARWRPSPPKKGIAPQFLAHVCCGQMAGWIKMALGTTVGLGPATVSESEPAAPQTGTAPNFRPMAVVAKRLDGLRCHLEGG